MFRAKILCLPDDPVFPVQAEIYGGNKPCRSKTDDDLQSADQRKAESQGVENPDSDPRTDKKGIIQKEQVGGLVRAADWTESSLSAASGEAGRRKTGGHR